MTESQLRALMDAGIQRYEAGEYEAALEKFRELEKFQPMASEIALNIGNVYFQQEQYDEARSYWLKSLNLDPQEANAYLNLGNLHFKQDQAELAVYYWECYKRLNKNNGNLWINLGLAYDKLQEPELAVENYSVYMGLDHNSREAGQIKARFDRSRATLENNLKVAEQFLKSNDLIQAADVFAKSLGNYPATPKIYKTYANTLYKLGRYDEALRFYLRTYDAMKQSGLIEAIVLINLGVIFEKLNRPVDACWAYYLAKDIKCPEQEQVHQRFATLFNKNKSEFPSYIQEIQSLCRQHLYRRATRMIQQLKDLGSLLGPLSNEVLEIESIIEEATDPSTRAARTYLSMGEDAQANAKLDQAVMYYQKFLKLKPSGKNATMVRQRLDEINQMMGAVVQSLLQADGIKLEKTS